MQSSAHCAENRRYPIGAEIAAEGGVSFRVWAPQRQRIDVVLEGGPGEGDRLALGREAGGYFFGTLPSAAHGTRYRFQLDGQADRLPDPASRFQPEGPFGPSQVVDSARFRWSDAAWPGARLAGLVLYEMHVGTFTPEGSWAAATQELAELASLGITCLEVMPIADFHGRFGWGYDGVNQFAPTRLYGEPDDLRAFVNEAHRQGLAVLLDVVYNHFGSVGNFIGEFSRDYFTDRYSNDWGEPINFDGQNAGPVREFFLTNVRYWIEEFHFDGLRLDATQALYDASEPHIIRAISETAQCAAADRKVIVLGENEPQHAQLVRPCQHGGCGLDALWNDDFHHAAMVRLTGRNEAYYTDYLGSPQEFVSLAKWGFLYQGQRYAWQKARRGSPTFGLPAATFVNFLQNHDQVPNSSRGQRVHELASPGRMRAMTAYLLLIPGTPLLFQGQEFASSSPFLYFADNDAQRARQVAAGRVKFLAQFRSLATDEMQAVFADPADPRTFERSKLDFSDRQRHAPTLLLHRDLLRLRREDPVFATQDAARLAGAVLSNDAFVLRFFGPDDDDRLLIVNFGRDLHLDPAPEPLLAPVWQHQWRLLWSSESPSYGGTGTPPLESDDNWRIPGEAAVVLTRAPRTCP
ncbi:MAG TPA: malto-oligosyltrehalose trehalohydrolase [Pirellulales bacterium]